MEKFELRRDRFELFNACENPLVNLGVTLELPDFRARCKEAGYPPFHFFLFHLLSALHGIDNFRYRIFRGEVIEIDEYLASYTVINGDGNLNFARFSPSPDIGEFIARSLRAKAEAEASRALINTLEVLDEREQKNNYFITCMPWFGLSSIEHPIFSHRAADIPSLAWGKYTGLPGGRLSLPLSVQAHHGFVDGYHVHLLAQSLAARLEA